MTDLEEEGAVGASPSRPIRGPVFAGRFHPEGVLLRLLSDMLRNYKGWEEDESLDEAKPGMQ